MHIDAKSKCSARHLTQAELKQESLNDISKKLNDMLDNKEEFLRKNKDIRVILAKQATDSSDNIYFMLVDKLDFFNETSQQDLDKDSIKFIKNMIAGEVIEFGKYKYSCAKLSSVAKWIDYTVLIRLFIVAYVYAPKNTKKVANYVK